MMISLWNIMLTKSTSVGFWDEYIIKPLSQFIIWLSGIFGNNYAVGIIVFTILFRLLLIPISNMQIKSQQKMQEIQPELDAIKNKYPNKDRKSMEMLQQEQAQLMENRGVNQFAGCLPLLIQLPIMITLYQTILKTETLKQGHFLWMNLGQHDPYFILPVIAAGLALYTSYLNMKTNIANSGMLKGMMYTMPIMILFITLTLPSALGIYFVIANAFTVVQTLLFNNPYKILKEREEQRQLEKDKKRALNKKLKRIKNK